MTDTADRAPSERPASNPGEAKSADASNIESLRAKVEEKYDFDDFGPTEMAEMSYEEWEAAFDPDTWIVGEELLDRVEQELRARVSVREIFGIIERIQINSEDCLLAYSDEGYAIIYPDGSIDGEGTIRRDVESTVALCSMEEYDLMESPVDSGLPNPQEVVEGSGEFGNFMLQIVAAAQLLVGVGLLMSWIFLSSLETIVAPVAAGVFILIGIFLLVVVANARLSDRFRVEEFRARLAALERIKRERPAFLPEEAVGSHETNTSANGVDQNHE